MLKTVISVVDAMQNFSVLEETFLVFRFNVCTQQQKGVSASDVCNNVHKFVFPPATPSQTPIIHAQHL